MSYSRRRVVRHARRLVPRNVVDAFANIAEVLRADKVCESFARLSAALLCSVVRRLRVSGQAVMGALSPLPYAHLAPDQRCEMVAKLDERPWIADPLPQHDHRLQAAKTGR